MPQPNILIILADDMGYSDLGCTGSEIATPNLDRLAAGGRLGLAMYNCAKCSPSRTSLLTGLYPQSVGIHVGPRNYLRNGVMMPHVLRRAGYRSYASGKWHMPAHPMDWGFDRYFGCTAGGHNYFNPGPARPGEPEPGWKGYGANRPFFHDREKTQPFTPPPGWYSTEAYTDHALAFLQEHQAEHAGQPFFCYLAYNAPHSPLQARPEDIAKYQGRYDAGYEAIRQQRHARQSQLGLLDPRWQLSPQDSPAWEEVPDQEIQARRMETYAAMVDCMDQNIGRVLQQLEESGQLDNTLILFLSDNGANSLEEILTPEIPPGPLESYWGIGQAWANVSNTSFRGYKHDDTEGGIGTPLIAHWPKGIPPSACTQALMHISDLAATCYEAAGATYPEGERFSILAAGGGELAERIEQPEWTVQPLQGISQLPVLRGEKESVREVVFDGFGDEADWPSRAVQKVVRTADWRLYIDRSGDPARAELYDMQTDRTETRDLAAEHPDQVAELLTRWNAWADDCDRRFGVEDGMVGRAE